MTKKASVSLLSGRIINRLGIALIVAGLLVGGISLLNSARSSAGAKPISQVLNNNQPKDNGSPMISGKPTHITIQTVNIDLNVIPGYYYPSTKSWTLSDYNAQWGTITDQPNNKGGDTFIYGHALMNVFGRLPQIKPGAQAVVITDNGHTFTYTYRANTIVPPTNTSLFTYQGKPILILQTCSGAWYQNRQLFVFDLSGVS
jgi:LPXTG-site transpeptidase (sortase) family protein